MSSGRDASASCRVSRRELLLLAATLLPASRARADLFGTDITVLLAQLEQQLALVSNAISTVQNLVRSVESLQRIYTQATTLLEHASKGDFRGILDTAGAMVNVAHGMTINLQRFNRRGGQWKDYLIEKHRNGESMDVFDITKISAEATKWNLEMVKDTGRMVGHVADLAGSYQAYDQIVQMVQTASLTQGVVGQLERLQGISAASAGIWMHQDQVASTMASIQAQRWQLEAAQKEAAKQRCREMWNGVDKVGASDQAADTGFRVDETW